MKFQDSSFNGLKVTVGTKSVTHAPTHACTHAHSKSNMPHQLFQSWGHKNLTCDLFGLLHQGTKQSSMVRPGPEIIKLFFHAQLN